MKKKASTTTILLLAGVAFLVLRKPKANAAEAAPEPKPVVTQKPSGAKKAQPAKAKPGKAPPFLNGDAEALFDIVAAKRASGEALGRAEVEALETLDSFLNDQEFMSVLGALKMTEMEYRQLRLLAKVL